jgi:hypothetical protein
MGEKAQQQQGQCKQGRKEGLERKEEGQVEEGHRGHHWQERDEEERGEGFPWRQEQRKRKK